MTTIFIGGSRAVSRLSPEIIARLDDFIQRGCMVFVGDANGADKAVQQYLASKTYSNVTVFCMAFPRNNVGGWQTRRISAPATRKGFDYYATKDIAMAREAQCGFMLWDGKSKGTLHNVLNLIEASKKVLVYFSPDKSFHKLAGPVDLQALLARCNHREIERLQSQLTATAGRQGHFTMQAN
jgi:adenine-specific DNA-methyltransferase